MRFQGKAPGKSGKIPDFSGVFRRFPEAKSHHVGYLGLCAIQAVLISNGLQNLLFTVSQLHRK
ncbi:MAG: hypothetical protein ABSB30_11985 [Terracidiphilus sp.]|jgi:hypothetical protein